MPARPHFALLASLRPDVLLIDEGIGTAAAFTRKAAARMTEGVSSAEILVLAGHSADLVVQQGSSALWLLSGKSKMHDRGKCVLDGRLSAQFAAALADI